MSILHTVLVGFILLIHTALFGQVTRCGTKAPATKPVITADRMRRAEANRVQYSAPYPLKVFIRVFADNDGSRLAATEADVLRQFQNMQNFYAIHNICFILTGYDVIFNTALNTMDVDEEESALEVYALTNSLTIFVHDILFDDDGSLGGYAYGIPNNFLSVVSSAMRSTVSLDVMAHEMGHCLGLLHTFESAHGVENRARTGSCRDCEDDGDLLCDTNADRETPASSIDATTCEYTGVRRDDCDDLLLMEPRNVMSYGRNSCHDHFTSGQGGRARSFLLTTHESLIAENSMLIGNGSVISGLHNYAARNNINFSATSYVISGAANANFSSREITFSPGVELKPNGGYVIARVGVYCQ